ncbi:hypothetical protein T492DRAFT_1073254 [Pavlovales sp. CCMP2436]|nr:hypothetical protein T492DRAFT_1073254 [Pavlovales sp. CCMP2436]
MGKYLILLDMNGTICFRSEEPVAGVTADLFVRRKHYYARRGIREFVSALDKSGKFTVCIYTSMMAHNVQAGLNAILPRVSGVKHVLDRSMNKVDPDAVNDWDTVRDMEKVWRLLTGYGPERTVLLDNEARKFGDTPRNGIVVPEFGASEARTHKEGTLKALQNYLLRLAEDSPADVRDYLAQHPPSAGRGPGVSSAHDLAHPPAADSHARGPADDSGVSSTLAAMASLKIQSAPAPAPGADSIPPGTSLFFVCTEDDRFTMSNPNAGITVRGKQPSSVRIQAKMDFHLLQSLVGKDVLKVEIDPDQFGRWIASRKKKKTAEAPAAATPAAALASR